MSQHDTLTLREALRSIQYDAASLADAQVIALQALNATYPARAALSATQPAQAAQSAAASEAFSAMAAGVPVDAGWVKAQAAQGAGEVVAWALMDGDDVKNLIGRKRVAEILLKAGDEVRPLTYADTQPAAGADVLDAERYRWLRAQDNEDFAFAVVKNPHFDVYDSPEELDAAIDAAIAASGRQE